MARHHVWLGVLALGGFFLQLSSCQIYNVEKRIQEDNLQQLALFSEYGRMALTKEHELAIEEENDAEKRDSAYDLKRQGSLSFKDKNTAGVNSAVRLSAKARADIQVRRNSVAAAAAKAAAPGAGGEGGDNGDPKPATESKTAAPSQDRAERPFQRLEFLVRDWQVRVVPYAPPLLGWDGMGFGGIKREGRVSLTSISILPTGCNFRRLAQV